MGSGEGQYGPLLRRDSEAITPTPYTTPYGQPALAGLRLLCVSENIHLSRREVVPVLKAAGFDVEVVEADRAEDHRDLHTLYDIVVVDIVMPDGAGFRFCELMRERVGLPIVLVLHGAARHQVLRGYALGADAHVLSPFDGKELVARMNALLRRRPAWCNRVVS